MSPKLKATFQILHFVFLVSAVLLFLLFIQSSKSYDKDRSLIETVSYALSGAWTVILLIVSIIDKTGGGTNVFFIGLYRNFLRRSRFLWISDTVLLLFTSLFSYQLLAFRQVIIRSDADAAVYTREMHNFTNYITTATANQDCPIRLPLGTNFVYLKSNADGTISANDNVDVPPIWKKWELEPQLFSFAP
jgi:hypothetical protein